MLKAFGSVTIFFLLKVRWMCEREKGRPEGDKGRERERNVINER
jgi:hypothetical protein